MADDQPQLTPEKTTDGESEIPALISGFTERIRTISECASEHIQFATQRQQEYLETLLADSTEETNEAGERLVKLKFENIRELRDTIFRLQSPHSEILAQSLLIFGFSTFDAYLGMLLRRLYREVPNLIFKVDQKEIKVSDLLKCKSLDEVIGDVVDRDISGLLRSSYDEQFSILANRYGISTLKKFQAWPDFVEAAQRRNLFTHCNGVVNSEYRQKCEEAGCKLDAPITDGYQLTVDTDYLRNVMDILYEVGVKLGHILWRKAVPHCIPLAEHTITDAIFELLTREQWHLAKRLGEFAIDLPNPKLELQMRISRINYAQAAKWSGDHDGAMKILDAVDWSGSIRDLRLGVEVLRGNYDNAAKLMREIGRKGELVVKQGYKTWPVFREFRKSEQFKAAFVEIYGEECT